MSFQAYLDNIKAKTGKSADDFKKLAEKKGLLKADIKASEIVSWLKKDFDLGHGHAMAIYAVFKSIKQPAASSGEAIDKHFTGGKAHWRKVYDTLFGKIKKFGSDINVVPAASYISILRDKKKMAIVQVANNRMDIGIKLKKAPASSKLVPSGSWNAMVTHRVSITGAQALDKELLSWLQQAYDDAAPKK